MLQMQKPARGGIGSLLRDPRVRQVIHEGETLYGAVDLVAVLTEAPDPDREWEQLKTAPAGGGDRLVVMNLDGTDLLDLEGVLRLVQSIDSPRTARLKSQIVAAAREHLEEADDPERALLRTRQAYEQQGRSRRWIDQRMRSVSARHELTGEWYRRGVRDGEQFRALTNEMMSSAFGMDVEKYRRYKGLFRTAHNLRDHMTDLELALMSLGETAAVELHRRRRSAGFEALLLDAKDAGRLIGRTRQELEAKLGGSIVAASNYLHDGPRSGAPAPRNAAA
jgi:hypothetical protein